MKNIIILFAGILFLSFMVDGPCGGVERWDVKTLTDSSARFVDTCPLVRSVSDMTKLEVPMEKIGNHTPRTAQEFRAFKISGFIKMYKMEDDSDFHVVLMDLRDSSKTLIAEFPNVNCESIKQSIYYPKMVQARNEFQAFRKSAHKVFPGIYTITGVAFFDKLHRQTGVAPNGIELHPVFSIEKIK